MYALQFPCLLPAGTCTSNFSHSWPSVRASAINFNAGLQASVLTYTKVRHPGPQCLDTVTSWKQKIARERLGKMLRVKGINQGPLPLPATVMSATVNYLSVWLFCLASV